MSNSETVSVITDDSDATPDVSSADSVKQTKDSNELCKQKVSKKKPNVPLHYKSLNLPELQLAAKLFFKLTSWITDGHPSNHQMKMFYSGSVF